MKLPRVVVLAAVALVVVAVALTLVLTSGSTKAAQALADPTGASNTTTNTPDTLAVTPTPTKSKAAKKTTSKLLRVKLYKKKNLRGRKLTVKAKRDVCYNVETCFDDLATSLAWSKIPKNVKSIEIFDSSECDGANVTFSKLGPVSGNGSVPNLKDYGFSKKLSSFVVRGVDGDDEIDDEESACSAEDDAKALAEEDDDDTKSSKTKTKKPKSKRPAKTKTPKTKKPKTKKPTKTKTPKPPKSKKPKTSKPSKSKSAKTAKASLLRVKLYKKNNMVGKKLSVKAKPDVCYSVDSCFDDLTSSIAWSKVPSNVRSIEIFDSTECDGASLAFSDLGAVGGNGSVPNLKQVGFSDKLSSFVVRSVDGDDEIEDEESACTAEDDAEALADAEDDDKATKAPAKKSSLRVRFYKKQNLLGKHLYVKAETDVCYSVEPCFADLASSLSWTRVPRRAKSIELFDLDHCGGASVTFSDLGAVNASGNVTSLGDYGFSKKLSSFVVRSTTGDDEIDEEKTACAADDSASGSTDNITDVSDDDDTATKAPAVTTASHLRVRLYKKQNVTGKYLYVKAQTDVCYSVDSCFNNMTSSLSWTRIPRRAKSIELFDSVECGGASVTLSDLGTVGGNGSVASLAAWDFSKKLSSFIVRSTTGDNEITEQKSGCAPANDTSSSGSSSDSIADVDVGDDDEALPAKATSLRVKLYKKADLTGGKFVVVATGDVCYNVDTCFGDKATSLSWAKIPNDVSSIELFNSVGCVGSNVSLAGALTTGRNGSVSTLKSYNFDNKLSSFIVRTTTGAGAVVEEVDSCDEDDSSSSSGSNAGEDVSFPDADDEDSTVATVSPSEDNSSTTKNSSSVLKVKLYNRVDLNGSKLVVNATVDVCYTVDSCYGDKTTSLEWLKTPSDAKSIELFASASCTGASVLVSDLGVAGGRGNVSSLIKSAYKFNNLLSSFVVHSKTGNGAIAQQASGCSSSSDSSSDSTNDSTSADVTDDEASDAEGTVSPASAANATTVAPSSNASTTSAPAKTNSSSSASGFKVKLYNRVDLNGSKLVVNATVDVCYTVDSCYGDKTTSLEWLKTPSDAKSIELFASASCTGASVLVSDLGVAGGRGNVSSLIKSAYKFNNLLSSFVVHSKTGNGAIAQQASGCSSSSDSSSDSTNDSTSADVTDDEASDAEGTVSPASAANATTVAPSSNASTTSAPAKTNSSSSASGFKVKLYDRVDLNGSKLVVNATVDVCYTVDSCYGDKTTSLEWLKTPSDAKSIELFASASCTGASVLVSDLGVAGGRGNVSSLIKSAYKFNNLLSSFVVHSKTGNGAIAQQTSGCSSNTEIGSDGGEADVADDATTVSGNTTVSDNATTTPPQTSPPTTLVPTNGSSSGNGSQTPAPATDASRVTSTPTSAAPTPAPTTKKPTTTKIFKVKLYTSANLTGSHHYTEAENDVCYSVDTCFDDKTTSIAWVNTPKDSKSIDLFDGAGCTGSYVTIASLGVSGGSGNMTTLGKTTLKFNNLLSSFVVRSTSGKNVIQSQVDDCAVDDASGSVDGSETVGVVNATTAPPATIPTSVATASTTEPSVTPNATIVAPGIAASTLESPASPVSTTAVSVTPAPASEAPASPTPTTEAPVTPEPTTKAPMTPAPTTEASVTPAPTSATPVTPAPTTETLVTPAPTTVAPMATASTSADPVTAAPMTAASLTTAPVTATVTPAPTTEAPTPAPTTKKPTTTKIFKVKLYTSANLTGSHHYTEAENDVCYSVDTCFDDKTTSIAWVNTPKDSKSIDLFDGAGCTGSYVTIASLGVSGGSGNMTTLGKTTLKFNNLLSSFVVRSTSGKNVIQSQVDDCAVDDASGSVDAADVVMPIAVTVTNSAPADTVASTVATLEPSAAPTPAPTAAVAVTPKPTTLTPATVATAVVSPVTTVPSTSTPVTSAPATEAPVAPVPTTDKPVTPSPTTDAPVSPAPTALAAPTPAPTTELPVTPAPTTEAPVTPAPTTEAPATPAPTTEAPVTPAPTTKAPPVTTAPVTATVTPAPTTKAPTPAPTTKKPTTTKIFKVKLYTSANLTGSHHYTEAENDVCYSVDTCFDDKTTSIAWVNTPKDSKSIDLFEGAGCTGSYVTIASLGVSGGSGNMTTLGKTTLKFNNLLSSFVVRSTSGKNVIQSQVDDCAAEVASGSA